VADSRFLHSKIDLHRDSVAFALTTGRPVRYSNLEISARIAALSECCEVAAGLWTACPEGA